jgi:hypothetical protein
VYCYVMTYTIFLFNLTNLANSVNALSMDITMSYFLHTPNMYLPYLYTVRGQLNAGFELFGHGFSHLATLPPHISRHFCLRPPRPPPSVVKYRLTLDRIVRGELKCRLFIKILAINKFITQTTYYEHFLSHFIYKLKQGYVLSGCCFLNSIL